MGSYQNLNIRRIVYLRSRLPDPGGGTWRHRNTANHSTSPRTGYRRRMRHHEGHRGYNRRMFLGVEDHNAHINNN